MTRGQWINYPTYHAATNCDCWPIDLSIRRHVRSCGRWFLPELFRQASRHKLDFSRPRARAGITAYLEHPDAKLEEAQKMAAHSDPKTTRLYDRRSQAVMIDDVERIRI